MTSLVDTAITYAQQFGWAVHPVNVKKQPITPHGRNDATRDESTIRKYFRNGAQIGVATGPESNLFVLDVDLDEARGINGYETLAFLEAIHGELPPTPQQRTGRGGTQYLFRYADGLRNSSGKIGAGIDTRGSGGYIVVAPSHNTNGAYEWIVAPDAAPLAEVPAWLLDLAREAEAAPVSNTAANSDARGYCQKMLGQAVARVATAPDGQKHDMLLKMARWMGGFVPTLSASEIESALFAAIEQRADDHRNARKTIRDGIAYGEAKPIALPERQPAPAPRQHVDTTTGEILPPAQPTLPRTDYVVDWRGQGVTLAELQYKEFDPEKWIVENILPEGACLFAAKYKSKKSWLALAISLAIAMGGRALGRLSVAPGRVLFLDLEGKQQRIQKRTRAMLGVHHVAWPANFHIFTKWPQGDEGLTELEHWLIAHPDTALIVIDVLASFRRPMQKHEEFYRYDRDTVDPINELAERYHVAILLVHHFNKGKHDDIMDSITGSTGLPSAVNTMWGLRRDVNDSSIQILELRGRDLENEEPLALKWDSYLNQHIIEGPANEIAISTERKAILRLLSDDESRTPKELAALLERPVETVKQLLRKLLNDGLIDKPVYGKYARVVKVDHSDHSDHSGASDHSDYSLGKSDRESPRVIGDDSTDHSCLTQQDGSNPKSDQSDRYYKGSPIDAIPDHLRMTTRMMLASDLDRNQEAARQRCEAYGVDFDTAREWARSQS